MELELKNLINNLKDFDFAEVTKRLLDDNKDSFELLSKDIGKEEAFNSLIFPKLKEEFTQRTGLEFNSNLLDKPHEFN